MTKKPTARNWLNAWRVETERLDPNQVTAQRLLNHMWRFYWPIPPELGQPRITDTQWGEISGVSGLPAEARHSLRNCIEEYRSHQGHRITPAQKRHELQMCTEKIAVAMEQIHSAEYVWGESLDLVDNRSWSQISRFELQAANVMILLDETSGRVGRARTGPHNRIKLHRLVLRLANTLFEFTGQQLSLSKKRYGPEKRWNVAEFIYRTCKIADPTLTDNAIRHALVTTRRSQARTLKVD